MFFDLKPILQNASAPTAGTSQRQPTKEDRSFAGIDWDTS